MDRPYGVKVRKLDKERLKTLIEKFTGSNRNELRVVFDVGYINLPCDRVAVVNTEGIGYPSTPKDSVAVPIEFRGSYTSIEVPVDGVIEADSKSYSDLSRFIGTGYRREENFYNIHGFVTSEWTRVYQR